MCCPVAMHNLHLAFEFSQIIHGGSRLLWLEDLFHLDVISLQSYYSLLSQLLRCPTVWGWKGVANFVNLHGASVRRHAALSGDLIEVCWKKRVFHHNQIETDTSDSLLPRIDPLGLKIIGYDLETAENLWIEVSQISIDGQEVTRFGVFCLVVNHSDLFDSIR
jgi:hypothetical protein